MAVVIEVTYEGSLRCGATHQPSQCVLLTDAPLDNQGRGESFSPTDLIATALATCMATIMGIVAERDGLDINGSKVRIEKHMVADPKRRIGALKGTFHLPSSLDEGARKKLEEAAMQCPVMHSIDPRIEKSIEFVYA